MTKQLITEAIFESLNISHADAQQLAEVVLKTIRDEIRQKGEIRLPGIGTWRLAPPPKRIQKMDLIRGIAGTGLVSQDDGRVIANALLELLTKRVLEHSDCIVLPRVGELVLSERPVSAGKRYIRFRPSAQLEVDVKLLRNMRRPARQRKANDA